MSFKISGFNILNMYGKNNTPVYNAKNIVSTPVDLNLQSKLVNGGLLSWDEPNQNWTVGTGSSGSSLWQTTGIDDIENTNSGTVIVNQDLFVGGGGSLRLGNQLCGEVTLTGSMTTVNSFQCNYGSKIFLTHVTRVNPGNLTVTAGVGSFDINSDTMTDSSVVNWLLINN